MTESDECECYLCIMEGPLEKPEPNVDSVTPDNEAPHNEV